MDIQLAQKLRSFFKEVAGLGLKTLVTEMDVTKKLFLDISTSDQIVAGVYEDYLSTALSEPSGLSERYTWSRYLKRQEREICPLPLDAALKRRLAWNAIALSRSIKS